MCLIVKDKQLHLAYKKIDVYKILQIRNSKIITPFQGMKIYSPKIIPANKWDFPDLLDGWILGFSGNEVNLDKGFIHCWQYYAEKEQSITVRGHIPIGSFYAIGKQGDLCTTKFIIDDCDWGALLNRCNSYE